MGLLGGSHCLVMCAAPCAALTNGGKLREAAGLEGAVRNVKSERPVHWHRPRRQSARIAAFHIARMTGYAFMGALAATAMQGLAWTTQQATALRPVWTLAHLAVLTWGLWMLFLARQPAWAEFAGRALWIRVHPLVQAPGGALIAGALWGLMPCGLLYSALLVAALSRSGAQGALAMAFFAAGSSLWLLAGPWDWRSLRQRINIVRTDWGTRLGGGLLCAAAGWALWRDLAHRAALVCQ